MADGVPLIQCDTCGTVTPARFSAAGGRDAVSEQAREVDLRREGWTLGPDLDECPRCTTHRAELVATYDRPCPHCAAAVGSPCYTASGVDRDPHAARRRG